jgi:hypothetical protein
MDTIAARIAELSDRIRARAWPGTLGRNLAFPAEHAARIARLLHPTSRGPT